MADNTTEITLAEYTGHLFQEMVRARQMADAYSRQVALEYREDAILQHFAVPRFRIPKVQLTIPVLVEHASVRSVSVLTDPRTQPSWSNRLQQN